ncbi:hypothetical protein [Demequina zhanjiangensis]|uniref:PKD domain-containing protein n=1 Tax=Demequina zhanjiangensis TaxID=3051659 RepID=A0ABT8G2V8_9MICO|nr:hypothetical protein [Demequina sp. SYSU T00b26]MDN4473473.1 hypothetical protein [Demequina sp. SYSU T00b26]
MYLGCPDDTTESLTTLQRTRTSATDPWSDWEVIDWVMCSPITPQTATIAQQVRTEWAQLKPGVPDLTIQPDQDWVYSTVPTIAFVDPTPVVIEEVLLGTPVRIRATPSTFTWNWGDGETTTTADPGKPYPDDTISHTYLYVDGAVDLTLQTTWAGSYSVNGGSWVDIDGTLTTTSNPVTLTVRSPHSALVDCDLNGTCLDG